MASVVTMHTSLWWRMLVVGNGRMKIATGGSVVNPADIL